MLGSGGPTQDCSVACELSRTLVRRLFGFSLHCAQLWVWRPQGRTQSSSSRASLERPQRFMRKLAQTPRRII
ncbi:gem (nuclear organelle) associated protein 6, isoform CRA_b [Rattus norvegicus]|uniref:Gem (Nuclear organelle) associated protein 6, isoform CRA_b n=1 Tax=Rattus norvegicus TaxID=10116 RepID=A6H9R4_RAT|nr:gem (nuclear organelle) associated protein 6, isoform CRA_b [Rattus norvegicus]